MSDIFGREPMIYGGTMAADSAIITFAGLGDVGGGFNLAGLLCQSLQLSYSQPVQRIYDFGVGVDGNGNSTAAQYFIIGHPQGQGVMNRVIGPLPVVYCFYLAFGHGCAVQDNNFLISVAAGCGDTPDPNFEFLVRHCLLTNYGFAVASQDMLFSESLPFMFVSLSLPVTPEDCGLVGNNAAGAAAGVVAGAAGRLTADSGGRSSDPVITLPAGEDASFPTPVIL